MDIKKRLNSIIQKDKETNPKFLINVIKSDFYYLISNYFEVDFDDIDINIIVDSSGRYEIDLSCLGDRMKMMRSLPD